MTRVQFLDHADYPFGDHAGVFITAVADCKEAETDSIRPTAHRGKAAEQGFIRIVVQLVETYSHVVELVPVGVRPTVVFGNGRQGAYDGIPQPFGCG